ncbi:dephospho-CoA kinase [Planococcus beigongshangi]|uniref:dephospho-CoA kinase n=1 Tax=Planococcus beigongshangi TaxID=2782536 RepID=UPI00254650FC|nr:dephospho-CoA kinase [Planococcus beigongshangi]
MIIGLTGSIASGKSTVSKMLEQKGYPIVDADIVARQVVEPGTDTLKEIEKLFGSEVIKADGSMDREKVAALIFTDPAQRKRLNDIIHPAIRTEMLRQKNEFIKAGHKTVIMDIPLLFESKLQHFVDKILVVSVTEENQLARLMERNGLNEKDARSRIASQLPMFVKEEGADAVIYNNGSVDEAARQLDKILKLWKVSS